MHFESITARGLSKTFPAVPNKFHVSDRKLGSRHSIPPRLGTIAGRLGARDKFLMQTDKSFFPATPAFVK